MCLLILFEKLGAAPLTCFGTGPRGRANFPGWRGGLSNSSIAFMGFLHTPWLVSADCPLALTGHPSPQTFRPGLQTSRLDMLSSRWPPAPGSGTAWGQGGSPAPPRALHLKEINRDHQKPAALIEGILFLVSFHEFLQVFRVISQGPGRWSLCPIVSPALFPGHVAFGNDPK